MKGLVTTDKPHASDLLLNISNAWVSESLLVRGDDACTLYFGSITPSIMRLMVAMLQLLNATILSSSSAYRHVVVFVDHFLSLSTARLRSLVLLLRLPLLGEHVTTQTARVVALLAAQLHFVQANLLSSGDYSLRGPHHQYVEASLQVLPVLAARALSVGTACDSVALLAVRHLVAFCCHALGEQHPLSMSVGKPLATWFCQAPTTQDRTEEIYGKLPTLLRMLLR